MAMRIHFAAVTAVSVLTFAGLASAEGRTYGGFDCTDDCSGHAAGYKWAEKHNIEDEDNCPEGNSQSFHEGCVAYTQDPTRDPDADDDGHAADEPVMPSEDDDDDK